MIREFIKVIGELGRALSALADSLTLLATALRELARKQV